VFLLLLLLAIVAGLFFFKVNMLVGLITAVMAFYVIDLCLMLLLSIRSMGQINEEKINEAVVKELSQADWPRYTVLCPLYREAAVVPQFVRAMEALDYPDDKLQILFLIEDHDSETRDAIRAMNLPGHFKIVTVPPGEPRTKPRACNFGLLRATGDYVVIYDAEDIPDPLQLKKAVLTFANNGTDLACVQAKLNFYNAEQNLLTRLFTAEYSTWFDLTLPGLQQAQLALPLGGTSNHFRTATLGTLGAWDAFNVTEDCDLGLRLSHYGLKTAVLDSTTYEEANSQWKNWFRQRSRWIKGYMQTYLVHMRQPLRYLHPSNWVNFFSLQFVIGGKAAILLINPLMWTLLLLYLLFHSALNNTYHILFPATALYMGTLCLIFGNFLYTYLHLIGCLKRGQYKLIKWVAFMPLYWALSSVAAMIALYQLIIKPHYWEKTIHGLHLGKNVTAGSPVLAETYNTVALPTLNQKQETLA
jgi:cellulose synthase/poly-beta-1,6-N-acetylglucosamine synthase-like glycosyltransferase